MVSLLSTVPIAGFVLWRLLRPSSDAPKLAARAARRRQNVTCVAIRRRPRHLGRLEGAQRYLHPSRRHARHVRPRYAGQRSLRPQKCGPRNENPRRPGRPETHPALSMRISRPVGAWTARPDSLDADIQVSGGVTTTPGRKGRSARLRSADQGNIVLRTAARGKRTTPVAGDGYDGFAGFWRDVCCYPLLSSSPIPR